MKKILSEIAGWSAVLAVTTLVVIGVMALADLFAKQPKPATNQAIIDQTHTCEQAGLRARVLYDINGMSTGIRCEAKDAP